MTRTPSSLHLLAAAVLCLLLAACGGGGSSFSAIPLSAEVSSPSSTGAPASTNAPASTVTPQAQPAVASYAIGGTLAGLPPHGKLVLQDNGGDALTLTANGAFSFATKVGFNTGYAVTVGTQPLWSDCKVLGGSGTATADVGSVSVSCVAAKAKVTTLAGSTTPGSADGIGSAARFNQPDGIAVDANGNVYVADYLNNEIRKITPDGKVSVLAGSLTPGAADGVGTAASFSNPAGVAVDAGGNVYVADGNNEIRKITPDGVVSTLAGSTTPGSSDGIGAAASFALPFGISVDADGNLYVTDNSSRIRKITPAGVVTTLAGSAAQGAGDGTGSAASFLFPSGTAVDADGNVYVADNGNHAIRKITPAGVVTTLAGSVTPGAADGTGAAASFREPVSVAVDAGGNVYVADFGNNKVRMITPAGVVSTLAGSTTQGAADGVGAAASFNSPSGIAVDASGNVYVGDSDNNQIRKIAAIRS